MSCSRRTILAALLAVGFAHGQSVIENRAFSSLKKIFSDSVSVIPTTVRLSGKEKQLLFAKSQWAIDSLTVYVCKARDLIVGYGIVDNVKGKTQFISYLVAVDPGSEVKDIEVLAYRESYGGEIAYESFRKQFRQKTLHDDLKPGKDIKNISGATISVRAITNGIKRILNAFEIVRPHLP